MAKFEIVFENLDSIVIDHPKANVSFHGVSEMLLLYDDNDEIREKECTRCMICIPNELLGNHTAYDDECTLNDYLEFKNITWVHNISVPWEDEDGNEFKNKLMKVERQEKITIVTIAHE